MPQVPADLETSGRVVTISKEAVTVESQNHKQMHPAIS
jgi:hypothetical protein